MEKKSFDINEYVREEMPAYGDEKDIFGDFRSLCKSIKSSFFEGWEREEDSPKMLEIQKRAIIGYEREKEIFRRSIASMIESMDAANTPYPSWYESLEDAVYHENWGLAGVSEWFSEKYRDSSSAKIIGSRIYFMENGRMVLKEQTIGEERKEQLIKAFLLLTPKERTDKPYYETYLLDGTRITIYSEPMAKKGQSALVFRRYLVPSYSFEEQARRKTIPFAAIPLLRSMVRIGFNVVFMGAVRTAKTTFLSTYQSYGDPSLEGVMVETDPEIPMHEILPSAPIIQLTADGEELAGICKNLLRSDADYFILAEARDGIAMDTAVKMASKGTKRMKITFHSRDPRNFPLEFATEIVKTVGGDLPLTMQMVASAFDYLFHFVQLSDKSQKRLRSIYQIDSDAAGTFRIEQICSYDFASESWTFYDNTGEKQRIYGEEAAPSDFAFFRNELRRLSEEGPLK